MIAISARTGSDRIADYAGPQPRPIVLIGTRDLPRASKILQRQPLLVAGRKTDNHVNFGELALSGGF